LKSIAEKGIEAYVVARFQLSQQEQATMVNFAPQLSHADFRAILDAHRISAKDRPAIADLVYHGKPVSKALHGKLDGRWRRSRKNGKYAKCMEALLAALNANSPHKFPPKDYRAPKDYNYYC
jgi:hypothetical protein